MIFALSVSKALAIILPALILLVLAIVFATALSYLGKKLAVNRDERIDKVRDCLSGANCGACGYPGCDGCADAIGVLAAGLSVVGLTAATALDELGGLADHLASVELMLAHHVVGQHHGESRTTLVHGAEHAQEV